MCVRACVSVWACVGACMHVSACVRTIVYATVAHFSQLKVLMHRNERVTRYCSFSSDDLPASSFSTDSEASTNIVGGCRVRLFPHGNSGGTYRGNCKIHWYVCLVHNVANMLLLRFA